MAIKLISILGINFSRFLLRIFFCLTCQYIPPVKSKMSETNGKCCSVVVIMYATVCTTFFGIAVNFYPTIMFILNSSISQLHYPGIWDMLIFHLNGNETG